LRNPRLIYADLTGFGENGPDAALPGFDLTAFWARSGLLYMTRDAGEPPTWPVSGSGDNATGVCIYAAIATALYRLAADWLRRLAPDLWRQH
jgi:crotonobetainyl-CoA:carnitine CoA-transferase CaiB-like acyl-CoA transferase